MQHASGVCAAFAVTLALLLYQLLFKHCSVRLNELKYLTTVTAEDGILVYLQVIPKKEGKQGCSAQVDGKALCHIIQG